MKKKEKNSKIIKSIFFSIFLIWILLQILSPALYQSNTIDNLSGITGIKDNELTTDYFPFPINVVYSAGDYLCHQKSERSIYINENQMPFCSRCTAIWFGIVIGIGIMIFYSIELNNKFLIAVFLGILPLGIDGVGQLIGLWESTNIIRLLTGSITGIVCGLAIGIIIDEIVKPRKIN
jgi:uncharacterized membrane protein